VKSVIFPDSKPASCFNLASPLPAMGVCPQGDLGGEHPADDLKGRGGHDVKDRFQVLSSDDQVSARGRLKSDDFAISMSSEGGATVVGLVKLYAGSRPTAEIVAPQERSCAVLETSRLVLSRPWHLQLPSAPQSVGADHEGAVRAGLVVRAGKRPLNHFAILGRQLLLSKVVG
jgi:hypothetical protein